MVDTARYPRAAFVSNQGIVPYGLDQSRVNLFSYAVNPLLSQYGRKSVLIGDSITARGNYSVTISSLSQSAGIATASATTHALYPGATVGIVNAADDAYNGIFTVLSIIDANTFTYSVPASAPASTSGATMASVAQGRLSDRNWFELANATLGHPFKFVVNAGATGQTLTQIAARFDRDALSQLPDIIQIQGGINDVLTAGSSASVLAVVLATMKTKYQEMIFKCIANNIIPLCMTITPLSNGATGYQAFWGQLILQFNQWLRQFAYNYPQSVLFDAWATCGDSASATGNWLSNYAAADGIHPVALATQRMGAALATILTPFRYTPSQWVGSILDSYDNDATNPQIDPNPLNTGTTGTKATSGAGSGTNTGNVPDNYTATWTRAGVGTLVCSIASRTDTIGSDLKMVPTAANASDAIDVVQTASLHARVAAGDTIIAEANVVIDTITAMSNLQFGFEWTSGGVTYTQPMAIGTGASGQLTDNLNFVLRSPPLTIPAAGVTSLKTRLKVTFSGVGGANVYYGRHSITKVQVTPT